MNENLSQNIQHFLLTDCAEVLPNSQSVVQWAPLQVYSYGEYLKLENVLD